MDLTTKKALIINLEKQSAEVKNFPDLHKFIGGVGLGIKLYNIFKEHDPLVISTGPLNGLFPFASKTSIILNNSGALEDLYIGGTLSTRLRFTGIDSLVFLGKGIEEKSIEISNSNVKFLDADAKTHDLGLPGKRSVLEWNHSNNTLLLDNYFTTHEDFLESKFRVKNIRSLVVTGTETFKPQNFPRYKEIYNNVLARTNQMLVDKNTFHSCSGCPMGCEKSKTGELGGNVLVHSLVACNLAERIYADLGITFSCLNVLGYDYTHEDIENLPFLIQQELKN